MSEIEEYYSQVENVKSELQIARDLFSTVDSKTDEKKYDAMEKSLALMYIYCPDVWRNRVEACMLEAEQRKFFVLSKCEKARKAEQKQF